MKVALFFVVGCLAVLTANAAPDYTTKYDEVDLDRILTSERLLKNYHNCLMDRGNCTPDGKTLRDVLPDAILNECGNCNERQKAGARKVIRYLMKNKPELWAELKEKFDPEGKHEEVSPVDEKEEAAPVPAETTA